MASPEPAQVQVPLVGFARQLMFLKAPLQQGEVVDALAAAQQNLAVALLLSGDVPGARSGFRQAISLLEQQNRQSEAEALRQQAGSMVKLDDQ